MRILYLDEDLVKAGSAQVDIYRERYNTFHYVNINIEPKIITLIM